MAADRVYPNNLNADMGSKISFNGIDWGIVEENIRNQRFATDQSDEIRQLLSDLDNMSSDGPAEVNTESEVMEVNNEPVVAEDAVSSYKGASNNNMRKIAFTHPNQISAEAIEIAEKAGDKELVKTILAARKANRQRIASAITENLKKEAEATQNKLNKQAQVSETGFSKYDLSTLENMAKTWENGNVPKPLLDEIQKKSVTPNIAMSFVSPTKFSKAQREAFAKTAVSLGMPKDYVKAMCAPVLSPEIEKLNRSIEVLQNSEIPEVAKTAAVKAMIKEAGLSPESKSEFIRYWNDTLGYQDKEFWVDVAADYTDGKKEN